MASRSAIRAQVHISIGGCCHEKNCQAHWEFRVQWVCPRTHWHVDSWSWDSNRLSISNFLFQSPANKTPSHSNWPQPKVSDQPASSWVPSDPRHWLFQGISYRWSCYSNETDLPLGIFLPTWVGRPVLHFRDVWKRHIKPGNINQAGLQAAVTDSWGSAIKMCIPKKRRKEGVAVGREERAQTTTTRTTDNHSSATEHTYCTRAETVADTATRESGCSAKQETQIQPLTANPWCIFHCPVRREEPSD